jgi:4,5-dihydroxyphthalate decarboxylase
MASPDNGPVVLERDTARAQGLYPLDIAFADYDRHRPLVDGRVKAKGLALKTNTAWIGDFCTRPVYEDYDAAEMSFSWYVAARDRGEPCIALPVFPLRMAVWAYLFVRADSNITKPSDLIGKRIGAQGYRYTVNLWLRGIFKEHYGFAPEQATWVTNETEGAGYVIPKNVKVEIRKDKSPEEKLKGGDVDAIWCTSVTPAFQNGEKWVRRLFPDTQGEMQRFVKRTDVMPTTHTLVMKKELAEREPWIAQSLFHAFVDAQKAADEMLQDDPKRYSYLDSVFIQEQQNAAYGASPYQHGLKANRKIVETFVRYAHDQGYISRRIPVEELFVPGLLDT